MHRYRGHFAQYPAVARAITQEFKKLEPNISSITYDFEIIC